MSIDDKIFRNLSRQIEFRNFVFSMNVKIEQEEKQRHTNCIQRYALVGFSLAACLALAFFVPQWFHMADSPLKELGLSQPVFSEYRSASTSAKVIKEAMDNKDYNTAIACIDEALAVSREIIEHQEKSVSMEDEASLYEKELEEAYIYQLRWMRIYALVSLARNDEAISELESFVTLVGEYQKDAKALLNKLKEK